MTMKIITFVMSRTMVLSAILTNIAFSITLDEFAEKYVKKIIEDFEVSPRDDKYDNIVAPPIASFDSAQNTWKLLPGVFIWSPSEHIGLAIKCPEHKVVLNSSGWTDDLIRPGYSRNPRLLYQIGGNVLLIQRVLVCPMKKHTLLSAQEGILDVLPAFVTHGMFPFDLHHRSGYHRNMTAFVKSSILSGSSFQQICESIASLNYESFSRRTHCCMLKANLSQNGPEHEELSTLPEFTENILFSFPSSDKLIDLFLGDFKSNKRLYHSAVENKSATFCLSTDHTLKISKHIGCRRNDDGKFVKQSGKLFIVLNEAREVVAWRLTKTTGHEEVKDLLESLNSRIGNNVLTYVIVDDCCKEKKLYKSIFRLDVEVKLDLFHAVQRVVRELPDKKGIECLKFSKEFVLIFREDGDLEEKRTMPTPPGPVIEKNLKQFIKRYERYLNSLNEAKRHKIEKEIKSLERHIDSGCLSGILPGHGTEANERLHSLLNRSMLRGANTIGAELAVAILALVFAFYNNKLNEPKHKCNSKIIPFKPLQYSPLVSDTRAPIDLSMHFYIPPSNQANSAGDKEKALESNSGSPTVNEFVSTAKDAEGEYELKTFFETSGKLLIENASNLLNVLRHIEKSCVKRDFNMFEIPFMRYSPSVPKDDSKQNTEHAHSLDRNLAGFGLEREFIEKDGDCTFRAFLVQLRKTITALDLSHQSCLKEKLKSIGLTQETEDDQIMHLRAVFVDVVKKNKTYRDFIPSCNMDDMEEFRSPGIFESDVGDLIIRVLADILSVPVLIISSSVDNPVKPILPENAVVPFHCIWHWMTRPLVILMQRKGEQWKEVS